MQNGLLDFKDQGFPRNACKVDHVGLTLAHKAPLIKRIVSLWLLFSVNANLQTAELALQHFLGEGLALVGQELNFKRFVVLRVAAPLVLGLKALDLPGFLTFLGNVLKRFHFQNAESVELAFGRLDVVFQKVKFVVLLQSEVGRSENRLFEKHCVFEVLVYVVEHALGRLEAPALVRVEGRLLQMEEIIDVIFGGCEVSVV